MAEEALYFAYGSNLHDEDRRRWCEARACDDPLDEVVATGWLPDHELAFHYRSPVRGGGALDVRPRTGSLVPGALYRVRGREGWAALDRKEGAFGPREDRRYERVEVEVLLPGGGAARAQVYRVLPERREQGFVAPAAGYAECVREGLERHGLDAEPLGRAARGEPARLEERLFVYGTLLLGEPRARLLGPLRGAPARARARGSLVTCAGWDFPAMPLAASDAPRAPRAQGSTLTAYVRGELVRLADPERQLAALDEVEGFEGFGAFGDAESGGREASLFVRRLIDLDLDLEVDLEVDVDRAAGPRPPPGDPATRDAPPRERAWWYAMLAVPADAAPISHGCWRAHRRSLTNGGSS